MVRQVNNIIFNLIVSGRGVWLPDIAALRIVRRPASRGSSSHTIIPPRLTVDFTSQREGISLVDEIARVASIDETAARDIYDRWIDKTLRDGVLTIEGVGVLRGKSFVTDESLAVLLNADSREMVKVVGRRGARCMVVMVAALLLGCAIAASTMIYFLTYGDMSATLSDGETVAEISHVDELPAAESVDAESVAGGEYAVEVVEDNIGEMIDDSAVAEVVVQESSTAESIQTTTAKADDIRYRVIIGSYSTRDNAERAVADAQRRTSELHFEIRPLGRLFAVVAFGAPTREECETFMRAHRKEFPQAWVNPPKR